MRALTRDPNSDKAKELAKLGAEVVKADVDDVESLKKAFQGAYGAYCVTFFWNHFSPDKEIANATNMAEAAKAAGVKHVIWSTLEDTRKWVPLSDNRMPTLQGKYKCPHFDAKGEADEQFTKRGLPVTFLLTTFYWDNAIYFPAWVRKRVRTASWRLHRSRWAKNEDGRHRSGGYRQGRLRHLQRRQQVDRQDGSVASPGEHLTGAQMAAAYSKALGQDVRYNAVTPEAYRGFGFPGAEDLGNMFQFYADFEDYFCGARNLETVRKLNPSLQTFDAWLAENKSRIPLD